MTTNLFHMKHFNPAIKEVEERNSKAQERRVKLVVKWAERRMECARRHDRLGLLELAEEIAGHGKCALGLAEEVKREAAGI